MTDLTLPIRLDPHSAPDETLHVTASGWTVLIYNINAGGEYPIHGAIFDGEVWVLRSWRADGTYDRRAPHDLDLRDRPKAKRGVWVARFEDPEGTSIFKRYATKAEATSAEPIGATLRGVTYIEEGAGLDTPADPPLWVDWAGVGKWVKWAAADESGGAWFYSERPHQADTLWGVTGDDARCAPIAKHLYRLAPNFDWRETLTHRPEGK